MSSTVPFSCVAAVTVQRAVALDHSAATTRCPNRTARSIPRSRAVSAM